MKKYLFVVLLVLLTLTITACKSDEPSGKTDAVKVAEDKQALTIPGDLNNVTEDLVLPASGENDTEITWESSNPAVIENDGTVTRSTEGDATVILTAIITLNEASDTKEFTVIVKERTGVVSEITNPGFETGDLTGWFAEGEAFKDDYVLDVETFWSGDSYNKDDDYLFTSNDHESETGTLTSSTFTLGGSGWISFKIGAAKHTDLLYIGIFKASDDTEIVRYGNTEFDDNLYTANLVQYKADLSEHLGEDLYIKIIDNATSDWAWISMDSFYTYYENETDLPEDAVLAEDVTPSVIDCSGVTAPSTYEIINGGFDTGNICGWTPTGEAFTHNDITDTPISWGDATYAPEGDYFYSSWKNSNEAKTGTLTSSTFELGGTGYITFRLGGAKPKTDIDEAVYILVVKEDGTEIATFMNKEFNDSPQIFTYKADLSDYIGENLYIKVVDNATGDWGTIFMDSFITNYENEANLPEDAILAENYTPQSVNCSGVTAPSIYDIINGGFDTGNICGWTATGDAFKHSDISDESISWGDVTYAPEGDYLYSSWKNNNEAKTGTLTSSTFELGGTGYITFRLGAAKPKETLEEAIYILIVKEDGTEIARFMNEQFNDGAHIFTYKADLSDYIGENLYIKVVDNATSEWGIIFMDSFITYYTDNANLPTDAIEAINQIGPDNTKPVISGTDDFSLLVGAQEPDWLEGVTAIDDRDGEVTVNVDDSDVNLNTVGEYTLVYTATDSNGNVERVEVTVSITSDDEIPPVISLTENEIFVQMNTTVPVWSNYATATDNTDGNITSDITITIGQFDISIEGTYTITYTVSDASLNETIERLTVHVVEYLPTIENGDFETGDLTGWTTTGEAFADSGVVNDEENNSEGYYFKPWNVGEDKIGTLTSSTFKLLDSGYITFKIGAAKHPSEVYVSIYQEDGTEIARYTNTEFSDNGYAYLYQADLSEYIGQNLYIHVVDNATTDWGLIVLDEFNTYYKEASDLPQGAINAVNLLSVDIAPDSNNEIINPSFENGSLEGWIATGDAFTDFFIISNDAIFGTTFGKIGNFFYTGDSKEAGTGTLTSSTFILDGSGYITFRLGAAQPKDPEEIYISVYTEDGTEVARFQRSTDTFPSEYPNQVTLELYQADLSEYIGQNLYIQVVDNATSGWGWVAFDDFVTYYENTSDVPTDATIAENLIVPDTTKPEISGTHDYNLQVGVAEPNWLDGVKATDDVDGEVTVTVDDTNVNLSSVGSYKLIYTASDTSGNVETVEVMVYVTSDDVTPPVISLTESEIYLQLNSIVPIWSNYATATDNIDGNITNDITIDTGQFDISVAGTYTITYTVSDVALNETTDQLTVHVVEYLPTIENGGFETGDFTGWQATGDAFTELGISSEGGFNSDGTYHFNTWKQQSNGGQGEGATGTLTSSMFQLTGSGYITFKIGGAKSTELIYIQVLLEDGTEIARYGNTLFSDSADMIHYKADLSTFLGQNMYIRVVDNATSDWAFSMLDSFVTYYKTETDVPQDANLATNQCAAPTLENGGFETGDFTGWTATGDAFVVGGLTNDGDKNSVGYYYNPWNAGGEELTGTLTSSTFKLLGSGYITFLLGSGKNIDEIYISVYRASDDTEIARYGNFLFKDDFGVMNLFKADLTDYLNEDLYIQIVDNATSDWAQFTFDEFNTYYQTTSDLSENAILIPSMLNITSAAPTQYDIANNSFETRNYDGWIATGDAFTDSVKTQSTDWWGLIGKDDYSYVISSDAGTGTLTSSTFTLNDTGIITFRMGGGMDQSEIYISVYTEDGTEIARFGNALFNNNGYLNLYKADLSAYIGQNLYIEIVDNDVADFGWISVDDFTTNYASASDVPTDATDAINILP